MNRIPLLVAAVSAIAVHPIAAQTPTRTLVEEMRIDGGDQEWSRVGQVLVAADRSIIVTHPGDFWASHFSPDGKLIKKIIRKGAGPGESQNLPRLGVVGDTLVFSDYSLKRISVIGLDGTSIRTILPVLDGGAWLSSFAPSSLYASRTLFPSWFLPNGQAIGGGTILVNRQAAGEVNSLAILRMGWNGVATGMIANLPFGRTWSILHVEGQNNSPFRQPFVSDPAVAVSPDGSRFAMADAVEGEPLIDLMWLKYNGDTVRRARIPYTASPVTARMIDSAVNALTVSTKRPGHESDIRALLKTPKFDYPVRSMLLERDGTAWIELRSSSSTIKWLVVGPDGRLRHTVEVPSTTQIMLVDRGIWAVVKDADDVPSVVRFRLK